jgi:hypothetical protein
MHTSINTEKIQDSQAPQAVILYMWEGHHPSAWSHRLCSTCLEVAGR